MASQQSNRVAQELNDLRQKHLAKSQRDKLKDGKLSCVSPGVSWVKGSSLMSVELFESFQFH